MARVARFLLRLNGKFTFMKRRCYLGLGGGRCFYSLLFCRVPLETCMIVRLGGKGFGPRRLKRLGFCRGLVGGALEKRCSGPAVKVLLYQSGSEVRMRCTLRGVSSPVKIDRFGMGRLLPSGLGDGLPAVRRIRRRLGGLMRW